VHESDGEESLAEAFFAVSRQLRMRSREALAPWDITPSQARAVLTLSRHGPIRLSGLAERLRIAPRSATEVVDGLQERSLVERLPDPEDRRATLVQLSAKGTETAAAMRAARAAEAEEFFAELGATDRAELTRILGVLRGSS
jgi:DNA-binding MarR family transcriptional regulator